MLNKVLAQKSNKSNNPLFKGLLRVAPLSLALSTLAMSGCSEQQSQSVVDNTAAKVVTENQPTEIWPAIKSDVQKDVQIEKQVVELLSKMTLEQKVAQMIQPEIREITVADMRRYGFGSYLNGGGAFPNDNKHSTPQDWINLAEAMYQASIDDSLDGSSIPTMWGTDAVHGHNNVIGATLFPHNIGLGAANNSELITQIAEVTATEVMVTGIDWVFAPTVATVRDDRWGRTYEGYSEDPDIVKEYAAAIVRGLQGDASKENNDFLGDRRVISTVKHFIGDGGTVDGDDQGDNIISEAELFRLHAQGYVSGLTAGAQSVMASFNSWHGNKIHGNEYLLTQVLKNKMGFDGFVVGDWNGHGQIKGCTNESCPQAINAGLDIYMVPTDAWKPLLENTIAQVKQGVISQTRIDDAVSRILRVKIRAGLFDKPSPANRQFSGKMALIGSDEHRAIAKQAVRESLVLLKNKKGILPLSPNQSVLIAGDGADNIGKQSGGWTISWQGTNNINSDFPGGSSIYDGLAEQIKQAGGTVELNVNGEYSNKPDVAIVVFGEEPYAEGHGDIANLAYQRGTKSDLALLTKLKSQGIPVVSVFLTGRPLWMNAEINASDAFVVAWLPGSEGDAIADVLLTNSSSEVQHDFVGKLSFSWPNNEHQQFNRGDQLKTDSEEAIEPPLFAYGFGLTYQDKDSLADDLSELSVDNAEQKSDVTLFAGKVLKPWQLSLVSNTNALEVVSSTASLAGINYRTIDKNVQEDAFKISLNGEADAGIKISSINGFSEDLTSISAQKLSLYLTLKVNKPIDSGVHLSMNCEREGDEVGSCRASQNVQAQFSTLTADTWQEVEFDLACLVQQGMKFDNTVMPLQLTTSADVEISFSDIRFKAKTQSSSAVTCH